MYRRLTISLVLMGLAVFSLAAGAVAWFSDSGSADVSITAGSPDLIFDVNQDCDGDLEADGEDLDPAVPLTWGDIVPGDQTEDCIVVTNIGDGSLSVYVDHVGPIDPNGLLNHVEFRYWTYVGGDPQNNLTGKCGGAGLANAAQFTSANDGRGCLLGTLAEGAELQFKARATFIDSGTDQNGLQGAGLGFGVVVTGYTG